MSEGLGCKVQLALAQKNVNIWDLEKAMGVKILDICFYKDTWYLQAQKDQVIHHSDALVDPGGSPGTFQNSTFRKCFNFEVFF